MLYPEGDHVYHRLGRPDRRADRHGAPGELVRSGTCPRERRVAYGRGPHGAPRRRDRAQLRRGRGAPAGSGGRSAISASSPTSDAGTGGCPRRTSSRAAYRDARAADRRGAASCSRPRPTPRRAATCRASSRRRASAAGARGADPARDGRARPGRRQGRDRRDPRRHGRGGGGAVRRRPLPDADALRRARAASSTRTLATDPSEAGGFKDVTFEIAGDGAYSVFKWESGVHRVQRVPATESQGRIHTSTATVAVLPEAEEVEVRARPEGARDRRPSAAGARAASPSTRPTPRCASRTCRPASWSSARTSARSCRTRSARCGSCAPALRDASASEAQAELDDARRSQIGTGARVGEDPHVQLPAEPRHRPPRQGHVAQPAGRAARRARAVHRRAAGRRQPAPPQEAATT